MALSEVWEKGSRGGMELACGVLRSLERENHFRFAYDAALPIRDKLLALTQRVYGGRNVAYTEEADREINRLTELGFGGLRCAWQRPSTVFPMTPQSWGPLRTSS